MRKLFQFLYSFRAVLVFFVLEVISVVLILRNDSYHSSVYFNSSNKIVAGMYGSKHSLYSYLDLGRVNDSLVVENARLKAQLSSALGSKPLSADSSDVQMPANDSLGRFDFVPALVINNNVRGSKNHLTLNRGSKDGVAKGMGVISDAGVVGRVLSVSDNYAVVASLLHTRMRVSAKLSPIDLECSVNWDGESPEFVKLLYVLRHYELNPGDSVLASGFTGMYPAGTPIGTVEEVTQGENSLFHDVKVRLVNDFRTLDYVYVVQDLAKPELDSLHEETMVEKTK